MIKRLQNMAFASAALALLFSLGACSHSVRVSDIPEPLPDDRRTIPAPEYRKIYLQQDAFDAQVTRQGSEAFDLSRQWRRLTGNKKEAFNTNAFDEVNDCSWFINRHYLNPMTTEEIKQGSLTNNPPSTDKWTVVGAKLEGVTPGFTIKDSKGDRYVIKFDPPGWPELSTSVEMISSRLFHAMGYNTPEDYLLYFDPAIIEIGEGVTVPDEKTRDPRQMTLEDLDDTWARVNHEDDGTIRAVASKFISGKIIGPFRYHGTRDDDPNDIVPHQHRRELRGLRILCSWLNHWDAKANNSLDAFVTEGDRQYVKHYLIDFGSTLGSQGDEPMPHWTGFENTVDPQQMFRNTLGLGFYEPGWYRGREITYREIGLFDNKSFDPKDYKFIIANEAFEMLTRRDAFWGAKIVMAFSDEDIAAAVSTAEYSNPEAEQYLIDVLSERRDIIGRYWLKDVNTLDHFEVVDNGTALAFKDVLIESGLTDRASYQFVYAQEGDILGEPTNLGGNTRIPLPPRDSGVIQCKVRMKKLDSEDWSSWVDVFVRVTDGEYELAGVLRSE